MEVFLGSKYNEFVRGVAELYIPKYYKDVNKNPDEPVTGDTGFIRLQKPFPNIKNYIKIGFKPKDFEKDKAVECIGFGQINSTESDFRERIMTTNVTHGPKACKGYYRHSWFNASTNN